MKRYYGSEGVLNGLLGDLKKIPYIRNGLNAWEKEDFNTMFREYQRTQKESLRRFLLNAHMRLVFNFAKRYIGVSDLEFPELFNEAYFGENTAFEKFDPGRDVKFSTYATWWMRQTVTRAIVQKGRLLKLPLRPHTMITKIEKYVEDYSQEFGREPSEEAIAEYFEIPLKKVMLLNLHRQRIASLDYVPEGEDSSLGERIADDSNYKEQRDLEKMVRLGELFENTHFGKKEEEVLHKRYFEGGKSLYEVHLEMGITPERIRQIEEKAIKRIRGSNGITLSENNNNNNGKR